MKNKLMNLMVFSVVSTVLIVFILFIIVPILALATKYGGGLLSGWYNFLGI